MRSTHALLVGVLLTGRIAAAEPETEAPAASESSQTKGAEEILIKGQRGTDTTSVTVTPERATPSAPDAAHLMDLVPGGAVNWNGPISGQVQYRGMFGPRMGVRVGGTTIDPGGPNWMDPPLHYVPRALLDSIVVERGIASVSSGAETIGGSVRAALKESDFSDDGRLRFDSNLEMEGRSVDEAFNGGGLVSVANDRHRLQLLGSYDRGRSYESPEGSVRNTRFERSQIGSAYAFRHGDQQIGGSYRYNDTDDAGTPALPMDVRFLHTHMLNGEYTGKLADVDLLGRLYYTAIDHKMDNFSLRPVQDEPRFVKATGDGGGWDLHAGIPLALGKLTLGLDGHLVTHDANIFDPGNPAFLVENFNDVTRNRFGGFAEWRAEPLSQLTTELGVRYTRVEMDASRVASAGVPAPITALQNQFNARNRDKSDDNVDWVVKLGWTPREDLSFELGGGRKTRSPYHIERYQWAPLRISAGLADGRNYVGRIDLDPEVSHEVSGGLTWTSARWRGFGLYASPRGFYKSVDDYIQGVPTTDPLVPPALNALQFSNVDAELYGADADLGLDLPGPLQLDGTISYVRGKRTDIHDDLYRIAPLRGRATLSWQAESWFAAVEGMFAARQDEVSATNSETPTAGYEFMNLYGGWDPWPGVRLVAGIDNVTDALYRGHLAGVNRVAGSGVALGQRLPGPGRSFYGRIALRWGADLER